jgi:UDP-N-acetylglucosamine 2-epimerase (non-hydrolysing)
MDTAEVVGLEARSYWQNHIPRRMQSPLLTEAEARSAISSEVTVENARLCLLHHDRQERLCWQFTVRQEDEQYIVFTLNRKALIADEENLRRMLQAIADNANGMTVYAPLRGKAKEVVERNMPASGNIRVIPPQSYLQFGWLTSHAKGIITDSGNVAEEATFNGVPCITLNSYTEHIETVKVGTNVLVGEDAEVLAEYVGKMARGEWKAAGIPDRWDGRTAERIVQILSERA